MLQQVKISPDPYEPYLLSRAIRTGNFVFVSGQSGYGEDGRIIGLYTPEATIEIEAIAVARDIAS